MATYNSNIIKSIQNTSETSRVYGGLTFAKDVAISPTINWWLSSDCFKLHASTNLTYVLSDGSEVHTIGNTNDVSMDCVINTHDFVCKYWDILNNNNIDLSKKMDASARDAANGVCPLDSNKLIPISYLPSVLFGAMVYQAAWDAFTNTPALPSPSPANKGQYWIVSVAGTTPMSGVSDWTSKDWIVSNGTDWEKIDNTDSVSTVAGRTGNVVLIKNDVGLDQVDNTSDINKPVSTATSAFVYSAFNYVVTKANTSTLSTQEALCKTVVYTGSNAGVLTMPTIQMGYMIVNTSAYNVTIMATTAAVVVIVPPTSTQYVWVSTNDTVLRGGTDWSNITNKPTTLSAYGITDAIRTAEFIVGNGTDTSFQLTHNWNSGKTSICSALDLLGSVIIPKSIVRNNANTCTVTLNGTAPATNSVYIYLTEVK